MEKSRVKTYNIDPIQHAIREEVRAFGEAYIAPLSLKLDRRPPRFPMAIYQKMASAGYLGFTSSTDYGGKGKTWLEYATLIEELSYYDASIAFILSIGNLALNPIERFGTDVQKEMYLPRLIQGELLGAFALTEPSAGSDVSLLKMVAIPKGDKYVIDGEKTFISSGDVANIIVLIAREGGNTEAPLSAFIIPKEKACGFSVRLLTHKLGLKGSTTARLIFEGCQIPKENRLGESGKGFKIAMRSLDDSRVIIAAQAIGLAQACLDRSVEHAKSRKAFGGTLSNLGTMQDLIADMATRLEAARLLTYKAAQLMDSGQPFTMESAQAKYYAAETVAYIADRAVQIHGGYGVVGDYSDIEKLYRDARIIPIYEGTSEIQKMIIARNVLK